MFQNKSMKVKRTRRRALVDPYRSVCCNVIVRQNKSLKMKATRRRGVVDPCKSVCLECVPEE